LWYAKTNSALKENGELVERFCAEYQILQAGIKLIQSHGSTPDEIETYYWRRSNGEVSALMFDMCEKLLGERLTASHPVPIHAYFHCLLVAVIQEQG
jgi:hypothetical protein